MATPEKTNITTADAWNEWKVRCAAGLCCRENADVLRRFGAARFRGFVKRYVAHRSHADALAYANDAGHGWHLFETYARTANNRAGKRYKDWLFERADQQAGDFVASVESGATLLIRDAVRDHLRNEYAPAFMASLQQPAGRSEGESVWTLEDLLPDDAVPADTVAEREWQALADTHAHELYEALDKQQRAAIWARDRGVAYSDQRLLDWVQSNPARLQKTYQRCIHDLGGRIKKKYPNETPAACIRMACLIHAAIAEKFNEENFVRTNPPQSFNNI